MTEATMVWIQNHAREVRNANKAVLSYLAFKAHFDNGLAAWSAMDDIADACGISVKTVQRSINWLVGHGWLEPGQQDYGGIDPVTGEPIRRDRRTVVWNVICKDSPLTVGSVGGRHHEGDVGSGLAVAGNKAKKPSDGPKSKIGKR